MKRLTILMVFAGILCLTVSSYAQKTLSETETVWVEEAQAELNRALSDPGMSEAERLRIVERSAKTLKEYGQKPAFPSGKIPLAEMMDDNFNQCMSEIVEMNDWHLNLQNKALSDKMKLINTIQIEVIENQVQLLIPGSTPVQLTQDAVSSVFGWNIAEGFNGGKRGDAQSLRDRFKKLAESNELDKSLNVLIENHKESLRLINKDRTDLKFTDAKLRQKYKYGEATTRTISGYEGAQLSNSSSASNATSISSNSSNSNATSNSSTTSNSPNSVYKSNVLVGTWKFGFQQTGYFYLIFRNDGTYTFDDKMNEDEDPRNGRYTVNGNILILIGTKDGCDKISGKYPFKISDGDLSFGNIDDKCMERQLTLNHIWTK